VGGGGLRGRGWACLAGTAGLRLGMSFRDERSQLGLSVWMAPALVCRLGSASFLPTGSSNLSSPERLRCAPLQSSGSSDSQHDSPLLVSGSCRRSACGGRKTPLSAGRPADTPLRHLHPLAENTLSIDRYAHSGIYLFRWSVWVRLGKGERALAGLVDEGRVGKVCRLGWTRFGLSDCRRLFSPLLGHQLSHAARPQNPMTVVVMVPPTIG